MTIEEQLKAEILKKYKSVRAFTSVAEIPYSTVDSIFKRGISNAGIGTVIKIFGALGLDIESLRIGELKSAESTTTPSTDDAGVFTKEELTRISAAMEQLNEEGRERVVEYAEDLAAGGRFKKPCSAELGKKEA